jgi:hypothetical protein
MSQLQVKPGDRLIKGYYEALDGLDRHHIEHEMAVRSAFQNVVSGYSKKLDSLFRVTCQPLDFRFFFYMITTDGYCRGRSDASNALRCTAGN